METVLFVLKALLLSALYIIIVFAIWGIGGAVVVYLLWCLALMVKKIMRSRFVSSLFAYFNLYCNGFSISHYEYSKDFHVNRFYWNGVMIREMPDIDMVNGYFNTLNNGHSEPLNSNSLERR